MSYFVEAASILRRISQELKAGLIARCALLVGGGYSYESVRYDQDATSEGGDLDLILVLEEIDDLLGFLSSNDALQRIGYRVTTGLEAFRKDVELFRQGTIGLVRVSGHVGAMKVGINATTFGFVKAICATTESIATNKVAHSQTYSVIISAGADGNDEIIAKISPNISALYDSVGPHYLILDKTWYTWSGVLRSGTYTDFIASGTIVLDTPDGALARCQHDLQFLMAAAASERIAATDQWECLFANRRLFSVAFRDRLRGRFRALRRVHEAGTKLMSEPPQPGYLRLRTVFERRSSDRWYSPELLGSHGMPARLERAASRTSLWEQLPGLAGSFEGRMHLLNAEVFRLSDIVSRSFGHTAATVPSRMGLRDVAFEGGSLRYRDPDVVESHVAHLILAEAARDLDDSPVGVHVDASENVAVTLRMLAEVRIDVAIFLLNGESPDHHLSSIGSGRLADMVRARQAAQ